MGANDNIKTIEAVYEAFGRGDVASILDIVTDDGKQMNVLEQDAAYPDRLKAVFDEKTVWPREVITYSNQSLIQEVDATGKVVLEIKVAGSSLAYSLWLPELYGPPPDILY